MIYTIARFILFLLFKTFYRIKVYGRENFPGTGPLIVASNHVSFFDPIIVGISVSRNLNFLAKESLFRFKPFGRLLRSVNTMPIKREGGDINAFRQALNILAQGKALLIFPEGTRSKDENLQKPRHGIGFLEAKTGAGILPCYVKGSLGALPRHKVFPKFKPISVYFGKLIKFDNKFSGDRKERYMYVAERVMRAIRELKEQADSRV